VTARRLVVAVAIVSVATLSGAARADGPADLEAAAVGTLAMSGDAVTAESAAGETVASELRE